MDIRKVDLNLLLAFDALMQDGNLTRAGFRLGLSQPSMSHALARLRKISSDPLFVRVPSGMEPTPFAQQIAGAVRDGLALLHGALDGAAVFNPATCNRTFQILMSDIGEMVYLPRLITKLKAEAPDVNLRVLQLPRESYHDAFVSGEADLAIGFLPALKAGFYQQRLFEDSYICIARKGHPRVGASLSLEQFSQESHVLIEPAGSRYSTVSLQSSTTTFIERYLADQGLSRRIALRVPHFMVVPEIVQQTDLLATVPGSVMTYIRPMPKVKLLQLPIQTPRFEIKQFWHQRNHHDVANRWLRRLIAELFLSVLPPSGPEARYEQTGREKAARR
ncbi:MULTISPECIES: LysR family transcriptional regulator [Polaromonas]|uniref:LysR family transcriptional regulator n=1 Tax=Polaromonas aquatica TaxID=332657 RepID=A0ABW1TT86_9BURK